jgi:hypothetical protein
MPSTCGSHDVDYNRTWSVGFESASSCFIYYLTYIVHVIKGKISILVPQMYPKGPGRPSSIIFQSNSSKCGAFESCTSQTYLTR